MTEVTRILSAIEEGDPKAAEQLLPLVYDELRKLAAQKLAQEKSGQTLDATALVHEAYLRLVGDRQFASRRHFFAAAAEAMRLILIDNARRKARARHGGGRLRVPLVDVQEVNTSPDELLALDDALSRFATQEPAKADLVKLRFFARMSNPEAAAALGISVATAERWWAFARIWLYADLSESCAQENLRTHEGDGTIFSPKRVMRPREEADRDRDVSRRNRFLRRPGKGRPSRARRLSDRGLRQRR